MTPDALAELWLVSDAIKAKLNDLPKHLLRAMESGQSFEGIKCVHAFGNRTWTADEDTVLAELKKAKIPKTKAAVAKLRSPPQLEALLGSADKFSHLVHRPDRGATVVKNSDRRTAVLVGAAADFQPLEKE